jgi:hypothetical protein
MNLLAGQLFRNETGIPSIPEVTLVEGTWIDGPTAPRKPTATSRVTPLLRKKTAQTKRRAV